MAGWAVRGADATRWRIALAVIAPRMDRPATATRAGRKPAVKSAAAARLPFAVNTAVAIATPKAVPKRWRVLLTAEARPMSAGATALRTAAGATGSTID